MSGADIPDKIGKYTVERVLGRGAMGVVFLGRDSTIDRPVAIKTIHMPEALGDDRIQEFRERFLREARAAGRMNHPAIVTIYEANEGSEGGPPFIAMEYVEGTPWNVRIKQTGAQDPEDVLPLVGELASALDYAHRRGIIHRDIKPANIVQTTDGHVKLMDFGIARVPTSELTQEGQCPGTPAYMSPEQVRGEKVDGRSDLFSLGTVLYELLTGQKPFPGESITSITTQILMKPTPSALHVKPLLHPDVDQMLQHLMAKDPAGRYASAKELVEDIDAFMAGASLPHAGTSMSPAAAARKPYATQAAGEAAPAGAPSPPEETLRTAGASPVIPAEPITQPTGVVAHRAAAHPPIPPARRAKPLKSWLALVAVVAVLAAGVALAAWFIAGGFASEPEPDLTATNRLAAELGIPRRSPPETPATNAPPATPAPPKAKPKPKPASKPAEPPPAPVQNEPEPPPPPPPPPPDATVNFTFKSGIVRGEFWIKVDGKEAVHHVINRKASLASETYSGSFAAAPGTHTIRFEVRTELQNVKGVHEEQVTLESGKPRTLRIVMTKFNKELRFAWSP